MSIVQCPKNNKCLPKTLNATNLLILLSQATSFFGTVLQDGQKMIMWLTKSITSECVSE